MDARGRMGHRSSGGAVRSLLGSTALHGTVLGLGCLVGIGAAVRTSSEAPHEGDVVALARASEPPVFAADPREPEELAEVEPPAEPLPEPELVPLADDEPPAWEEETFAPLPDSAPDARALRSTKDLRAEVREPAPAAEPAPRPAPRTAPAPAAPNDTADEGMTPPVPLSKPDPEYPRLAMRRGEEGSVLCHIHVDAGGGVTRVEIERSSGHPRLDDAARVALATWRFRPCTIDGAPAASIYRHRVRFELGG